MSSLRFDHAIIAVNDLKQAQSNFEALGFTVFYGGKHASGVTENCLIVLQDDSYLELIARVDGSTMDESDSLQSIFVSGEGWVGYALLSQSLTQDVTLMRQRGLVLADPLENGRMTPDGERIDWRAANLDNSLMPFFLEDVTPRSMRVPDDHRRIHENGATGIAQIIVAVPELEPAVELYRSVLGQNESPSTLDISLTRAVDFALVGTTLTLIAPVSNDSALTAHLAKRSPGIYAIYLSGGTAGQLDASHTHSALLYMQGKGDS